MKRRELLAAGAMAVASAARAQGAGAAQVDDETASLQQLLDKGGVVRLKAGATYHVRALPGAASALYIGAGTTLDLNGATLKLLGPDAASVLALRPGTSRARDIKVTDGTIDGSANVLTLPTGGRATWVPTISMNGCDGAGLHNLHFRDAFIYAAYVQGHQGQVTNVTVDGAMGGGLHITGDEWHCDGINVRNVSRLYKDAAEGNPFIVNLKRSTVGEIRCLNFGFGVKFQDGCEDVRVRRVLAIGGANSADYLVKIQGKRDSGKNQPNRRIVVDSIEAINGPASGLYIYHSQGVTIGSYSGFGNGRGPTHSEMNHADILVYRSTDVNLQSVASVGAGGPPIWLHDECGDVHVDALRVSTKAGMGGSPVVRSGRLAVGSK